MTTIVVYPVSQLAVPLGESMLSLLCQLGLTGLRHRHILPISRPLFAGDIPLLHRLFGALAQRLELISTLFSSFSDLLAAFIPSIRLRVVLIRGYQ